MEKNFSIRESLSVGFATFKSRPWFFISLIIASFAVTFGVSFIVSLFLTLFMSQAGESVTSIISGISQLIGFFLSLYVQLGVTRLYLLSIDGKTPSLREIFDVKRDMFIHYLFVSIISGALMFIGFILLVIPGIIVSLMLQFALLCLIDDNNGFVHALQTSRDVTNGVKWKLLGFSIVSGLVVGLGILCLGVGVLVAMPVITLAHTHIYRSLRSQTPQE